MSPLVFWFSSLASLALFSDGKRIEGGRQGRSRGIRSLRGRVDSHEKIASCIVRVGSFFRHGACARARACPKGRQCHAGFGERLGPLRGFGTASPKSGERFHGGQG